MGDFEVLIKELIHQKNVELLRLEASKKRLELDLFSLDCLEGLEEMKLALTHNTHIKTIRNE